MSLTKFRISLLLAGVVSAAAIDPYPDTVRDEGGRAILALGPQQELAASNLLGSGLDYFPDEGTSLLASPAGTIRLLVGTGSSWLMTGNGNLGNVAWTAVSKVLEPDSASKFDNGYAGFSGAWTDTTGRVWGVYHAEDHVGLPDIPGTRIPGFYATVALAVSNDSGKTWTKEGPLVRSHAAKDTASGAKTDQGAGEPGLVASPDGKWLYLDYTDHSPPDNLDTRICLARIPIQAGIPQPSLCAKWDGSGFTRSCSWRPRHFGAPGRFRPGRTTARHRAGRTPLLDPVPGQVRDGLRGLSVGWPGRHEPDRNLDRLFHRHDPLDRLRSPAARQFHSRSGKELELGSEHPSRRQFSEQSLARVRNDPPVAGLQWRPGHPRGATPHGMVEHIHLVPGPANDSVGFRQTAWNQESKRTRAIRRRQGPRREIGRVEDPTARWRGPGRKRIQTDRNRRSAMKRWTEIGWTRSTVRRRFTRNWCKSDEGRRSDSGSL